MNKYAMLLLSMIVCAFAVFTTSHTPAQDKAYRPVVVRTVPVSGDMAVDPSLSEIRVTFSQDMLTNNMWSWVMESKSTFPRTTGKPRYLDDKRTCVLPVRLEPRKTYAVWINSAKFDSFRNVRDQPAVPYLITFRTKGK